MRQGVDGETLTGGAVMRGMYRWNRGQWISAAATAVGTAAVIPSRGLASLGRVFGSPAGGPVHEAVDTKLKAFPLPQVRLRPGIFLDQLESNQSFVESLPNDRLLHTFRLTAGISSTADPLGGWEHPRGELRGHFARSEEHTSELQSHSDLVCRLLLEKKNSLCAWETVSA